MFIEQATEATIVSYDSYSTDHSVATLINYYRKMFIVQTSDYFATTVTYDHKMFMKFPPDGTRTADQPTLKYASSVIETVNVSTVKSHQS